MNIQPTEDNPEFIEEMDKETQGGEGEAAPAEGQDEYRMPEDDTVPEKFRGKSPTDVVKSYVELEKMIGKKAEDMAKSMLEERGVTLTQKQQEDVKEITDEIDFSQVDFKKMTPQEFAKWMIQEVDKRAEAKARNVYQTSTQTQENVRKEIAEAKAKYPALKDNQAYKESVLAHMAAARAQGKNLSLNDACEKVNALMGGAAPAPEAAPEAPAKPKPTARTGVESTKPVGADLNETDEDKVKNGILNAGRSTASPMGGLGI